jgi:hypothetical protein
LESQSDPISRANDLDALLLTTSATTGWLDWIHGEFWLLPTAGLLRIPLGLVGTLESSMQFILRQAGINLTPDQSPPLWSSFDRKTLEALSTTKGNRWIPREHIKTAYLHHGLSADRLRLELVDQRTVKVLWLPEEVTWELLEGHLSEWLGNELVID